MRKVVILFSVLLALAGVARAANAVLDMDLL